MYIDSFNYDAKGASIIEEATRTNSDGHQVTRLAFNNGVVLILTEAPDMIKNIDTNYELIKQHNGTFYSDLSNPKADFHDYFLDDN